jgi:DNA processing protein
MRLLTVLDPDYPENLRAVHDRPPLIFAAGELQPRDARSIAVIGTRRPSPAGLALARAIAERLVEDGYTIVSGLAAGIDTAAHTAALSRGGRTIAVIGTGLRRFYPYENAPLQRRIAATCAVISQFWPDALPTRGSFPMRNAVMSGLALASVVVEATQMSGARTQARLALAHGRPVLLVDSLLDQPWARELAERPGTHVVHSPAELTEVVERLTAVDTLVA